MLRVQGPSSPHFNAMKFPTAAFLLFCSPWAVSAGTVLARKVRNTLGQPIAGLTIHLYRANGTGYDHKTVLTGPDGKWSVEVPSGEWWGSAHSAELLARGYFCFPGFMLCQQTPSCGSLGGLWGEGVIEWNPVVNPGNIVLTVVPTRPDLEVENARTAQAGVKVNFETTSLTMTTIRRWRIEKSTDLSTWVPMQTVALSGTSPVLVPDPPARALPSVISGPCRWKT